MHPVPLALLLLCSAAAAAAAPPRSVTAAELLQAYEDNAIVAQDYYEGAHVLISGRILRIGEDLLGRPVVELAAGGPDKAARCLVDKAHAAAVAEHSPGEEVRLACTVDYRMGERVHLSHCRLE